MHFLELSALVAHGHAQAFALAQPYGRTRGNYRLAAVPFNIRSSGFKVAWCVTRNVNLGLLSLPRRDGHYAYAPFSLLNATTIQDEANHAFILPAILGGLKKSSLDHAYLLL